MVFPMWTRRLSITIAPSVRRTLMMALILWVSALMAPVVGKKMVVPAAQPLVASMRSTVTSVPSNIWKRRTNALMSSSARKCREDKLSSAHLDMYSWGRSITMDGHWKHVRVMTSTPIVRNMGFKQCATVSWTWLGLVDPVVVKKKSLATRCRQATISTPNIIR